MGSGVGADPAIAPAPRRSRSRPATRRTGFPARAASRPALVRWLALCVLVVGGFLGVVSALNTGLYSAGGFVGRYLEALERSDIAAALTMPGVTVPAGASDVALTRQALRGPAAHRILRVTEDTDGGRTVTAEYELGSRTFRTDFSVRPAAPLFLFFSAWRFAETPVAVLTVEVRNDTGFRLNGVPADAGGDGVAELAVLTPTLAVLDQDEEYLQADEVPVPVVSRAGARAAVEVRASDEFVASVQDEIDAFLDDCAAQQVLQPAGCPFRRVVDDRILDRPQWSITAYPEIDISPADGGWLVSPTPAIAHITVDVVSLFDGSVSTLDEDVPFEVSYRIELRDDGGVEIRAG